MANHHPRSLSPDSGNLGYYHLLGKIAQSIGKLQLSVVNDPAVSIVLTELINLVSIHDGLIRNCFEAQECKSLHEEFLKRVLTKDILTKKC